MIFVVAELNHAMKQVRAVSYKENRETFVSRGRGKHRPYKSEKQTPCVRKRRRDVP
jgi:hypothetical protein